MLSLHFEIEPGEDYAVIGPAPFFRLDGDRLKVGPADLDIASYRQGKWQFPSSSFAAVTVQSPAQIAFESGAGTTPMISGPFAKVRLAHGAIWHGDEFQELLAHFDEQAKSWWVYFDQVQCSGMVIVPVATENTPG